MKPDDPGPIKGNPNNMSASDSYYQYIDPFSGELIVRRKESDGGVLRANPSGHNRTARTSSRELTSRELLHQAIEDTNSADLELELMDLLKAEDSRSARDSDRSRFQQLFSRNLTSRRPAQ